MGLIGLIVASVVNLFLGSSPLGWIISLVGVVLFTALTAYDVQRIQNGDYRRGDRLGREGARSSARSTSTSTSSTCSCSCSG